MSPETCSLPDTRSGFSPPHRHITYVLLVFYAVTVPHERVVSLPRLLPRSSDDESVICWYQLTHLLAYLLTLTYSHLLTRTSSCPGLQGDMKALLLDLYAKQEILSIKTDILASIVDVTSDAWAYKKNITSQIWDKVIDHWNKTEDARAKSDASVWDSLTDKLTDKHDQISGLFETVVEGAKNVTEWKWEKLVNATESVAAHIEDKKDADEPAK